MLVEAEPKFELPPEQLQSLAERHKMSREIFLAHFRFQARRAKWLIDSDLENRRTKKTKGDQTGLGRASLVEDPRLSSDISDDLVTNDDEKVLSEEAALDIQNLVVSALKGIYQLGHEVEVVILPPPDDPSTPDLRKAEIWGLRVKDRVPVPLDSQAV